jgi:hypothetical protein
VLAEPITVPDGDSFLQTPIKIVDRALPDLPRLTYLQMRRLHGRLVALIRRNGSRAEPIILIDDPALPELPKLERPQAARLATDLDRILRDPTV